MSQNTLYVTTGSRDNFWNGPDLNKKFLKADYQSKRGTMTVLSEALAFESTHKNIFILICLLMKQCSRVGI